MPAPVREPPTGAATSTATQRIPFYETDAMGIVHHANYVKYLELARIVFMDDHDRPYRDYLAMQLHFATTRVEIDYRRPLRFDDRVEVTTWIRRLRGASIHMDYRLTCAGQLVASASTQHAMVDGEGRPARIPREHRERLQKALGDVLD
jgi:acyl-CoA thioester hydrolase